MDIFMKTVQPAGKKWKRKMKLTAYLYYHYNSANFNAKRSTYL